jgi:DNA-binding PadR family transcriptional regulator
VAAERDLAPGEWSVLALLADAPSHGWALAREMSRNGEIGSVWSVGRPLVYRALELLEQRGLVEPVGRERGARGPNRELFRATEEGREALRRWLAEPVDHVREIRSLFLLKLVLIQRAGLGRRPLLRAQRAVTVPAVEALRARLGTSVGSERIVVRFRLESTRAVVDFIDALLDEEEGPQPSAALEERPPGEQP